MAPKTVNGILLSEGGRVGLIAEAVVKIDEELGAFSANEKTGVTGVFDARDGCVEPNAAEFTGTLGASDGLAEPKRPSASASLGSFTIEASDGLVV